MLDDDPPLGEPPRKALSLLESYMLRRAYEADAFPTRVVGYIDMLGFAALVQEHPGSLHIEVSGDGSQVAAETSKSAQRFGRFHRVLERMAMDAADTSRPERMMVFSDCAFAIYEKPLQAALSLAEVMRRFLGLAIPVRMCIAKGTCHFERFSIESFNSFNLTRSMFYGSGIVNAVHGEENAGRGCRIFLHESVSAQERGQIEDRMPVLPMPKPAKCAQFELNYLNEQALAGEPDAATKDLELFAGLTRLRNELRGPTRPEVLAQYDESFSLFNRMRARYGRDELRPPAFDENGNPVDAA